MKNIMPRENKPVEEKIFDRGDEKIKHLCDYRNLNFCIRSRMQFTKLKRVIKLKQTPLMKNDKVKYTDIVIKSTTNFGGPSIKILKLSVNGYQMGNIGKRRILEFVTSYGNCEKD